MSRAEIIQRLPEEWRITMLELVESVERDLRDQLAVRRQDFDQLWAVVHELAEAQKRTEQRVAELAVAQRHTSNTVSRLDKKFEAGISAVGARWGWRTEESFRSAIESILSDIPEWRVEHVQFYDPEGQVFGRPDQVEIDVAIRNGQTMLIEIKSSMSKGDVYIFDRKVAFYQKRQGIRVDRKIIITPMLDPRAQPVVEALGMQVFSSAYGLEEIPPTIS